MRYACILLEDKVSGRGFDSRHLHQVTTFKNQRFCHVELGESRLNRLQGDLLRELNHKIKN
jgi:hypothetical protein